VQRQIETPRNVRSRRTRTAILDAAWHLIEDGGAHGLSMSEVARRAGVTRAGAYMHFASRGELLLALFKHANTVLGLADSIRPIREAPDALAALGAWADHLARFHARIHPLLRALDRVRDEDGDAAALWRRVLADGYDGCRGIAARLAAEEHLVPPWDEASAADLLWALMSPEVQERLMGGRGWPPEEAGRRLALLARRTLTGNDVGSASRAL
jgi:AcrR family transcriptional regulator